MIAKLKVHNYNYNKIPVRQLSWKAPIDYIKVFIYNGKIFKILLQHIIDKPTNSDKGSLMNIYYLS